MQPAHGLPKGYKNGGSPILNYRSKPMYGTMPRGTEKVQKPEQTLLDSYVQHFLKEVMLHCNIYTIIYNTMSTVC